MMAVRQTSETGLVTKKFCLLEFAVRAVKSESNIPSPIRPLQIVDSLTLLSPRTFKLSARRRSIARVEYVPLKNVLSELSENKLKPQEAKSQRTVSFNPSILFVANESKSAKSPSLNLSMMNVSSISSSWTAGKSATDFVQLTQSGKTATTLLPNKQQFSNLSSLSDTDESTDLSTMRHVPSNLSKASELTSRLAGCQSMGQFVKVLESIADNYVRLNKLIARKSQSHV